MVKIDKNGIKDGRKWNNERKNEQICYCNSGLFTIYLGQTREKAKPIKGGIIT